MANVRRDIGLEDVQEILGRALVDSEFRGELLNEPESTLAILGFKMSQDSQNFFKALKDETFLAAAEQVESRLGGRPVIAAWL